jgi:eukaryotic-like serine/threonine-protein kinase
MSFLREANAEPLPGYRLIEPLGSGGFGEAWKCEAPGGLYKAIKFVFGNLNSLDVDGARAEQELKALNRVKEVRHPFVLSMDRIEVVEGELVIVMELADRNLQDAYEECLSAGLVGIPRDTLLCYIRDAADALDHMNEKHNLQHLDVKPRNLFLISDRVKVADFGLVKTLERAGNSGHLAGVTPLYAAPETFGNNICGRSDQYSLAIVYQELLTGQRPFAGKNARVLAQQHQNQEPDLRVLPEADRPVVARALAKDPAKRFPNCLAFVRALYTAAAPPRAESIATDPDGSGKRPRSLADSMENMLLEQMQGQEEKLEVVDLGAEPEDVSQLGITVPQPQTGSLRPTLIIGIGSFGRRALMELRCRFLDRFGDLEKLPLVRFLYLDTDPEAARIALRGTPEVAFKPNEIYHLALQPVAQYRRRQLDQLNDWLPREKLYALPRSLKTQGSRALGRLAFTDHYLRLMARLKKEVQTICHPDSIYKTVSQTGLALRDNVPRVYVVACASGGGSGALTDLGYAVRRLLKQMRHPESPVTAFLFCGAPDDPATPRTELANTYATLTELNHFADTAVPFSAQYGTDGPRLVDEGTAYDNAYLLTLAHRTPENRRDALAHLGSYLFHEMTTPLGLRLDRCRMKASRAPFRAFGTYGVWFPRGLMLRLAARHSCHRLLEEWQTEGEPTARDELEAAHARIAAESDWRPEALVDRLAELVTPMLDDRPADQLTKMLVALEEQAGQFVARDDPGSWARQALTRVKDWLGSGVQQPGVPTLQQRKSRLTKALEAAAAQLAEKRDVQLTATVLGLMEHPGRRIAVAEEALMRFIVLCNEASAEHADRHRQESERTQLAREQLEVALQNCLTSPGGFSWFGGKARRQVRVFLDRLAAFARQCLSEDLIASAGQVYGLLRGRLSERLRELTFCRQRVRHMQEALEAVPDGIGDEDTQLESDVSPSPSPLLTAEEFWEAIRGSATMRVVLPDGERDMETAARRFVTTLAPEHWSQLDQAFQDQILAVRGGLHKACMATGDLVRHLLHPLLEQTVAVLSGHLPVTDVAQVEFSTGTDEAAMRRMQTYYHCAVPLVGGAEATAAEPAEQHGFVLIPASDAGKRYGEMARQVIPGIHLVNVPGQADLMFCREQRELSDEEFERILHACQPAYSELARVPTASPHARFDIHDWAPLEP